MIVDKNFIEKLKAFGLNSYEAKIWTALLSRGVSSAGELSDISNVPRSRSYDVLESLEKKGFIVMKVGKPIKYIAVPPEEVLERVKKKVREDASYQSKKLESLRDSEILDELTVLHTQGVDLVEPTELTGSFRGRSSVYDQMQMMIKSAEERVVVVTTEEGLIRKGEAFIRSLKKASERGVDIKIAAPITSKSKDVVDLLKPFAEIRYLDKIKARFVIVDGKEITFMLLDDELVHQSYDVGVWVNTPYFAEALESLFLAVWDKMKVVSK